MDKMMRILTAFLVQYLVLCILSVSVSVSATEDRTQRRSSNVCKAQFDCPLNAFCEIKNDVIVGYCVCREGYVLALANNTSDRQCIPVAVRIGDSCEQDTQCTIAFSTEAECREGYCQCKPTAHFKENACYFTAKVGERCKFNNNCYIGENHPIFCTRGFCSCSFNQHAQDNGTRCVDDVLLGDFCYIDDDCVVANSRCHDICRCQIKFVISQNGTQCLKAAYNLLDECVEDVQCTDLLPNTVCRSNKCLCKVGYHHVDQKCWDSVSLRGVCELDQQCVVEGAKCSAGICECPDGYNGETDKCINTAASITLSLSAIVSSILFIAINYLT